MAWKIKPGNNPSVSKVIIGPSGSGISNGHGIGFGDVNGDGLEDVIFKNGWYERPTHDAMTTPWTHHADWSWDHAGSPMLAVDLNNDGRTDVIWGMVITMVCTGWSSENRRRWFNQLENSYD